MSHPDEAAHLKFERLVFFSDAIFAIAITLLVLDLHPDSDSDFVLSHYYSRLFGFGLSFAVIGLYWLAHHRLFGTLEREDKWLRVVNLAFMAGIVFLPFPTSLVAHPHINNHAVVFYAVSVSAVGLLMSLLTLVARRPGLMRGKPQPGETAAMMAGSLGVPLVFLASAPVALHDPVAGMQVWWLIAPVQMLSGRVMRWLAHRKRPAAVAKR